MRANTWSLDTEKKLEHRQSLLEMEQGNDACQRNPCTEKEGVRYTLQQYRDDRFEANVREVIMERTAVNTEYFASDSFSAAGNPRRRAVLRETSMPSAFEYVNYNMPETVPQEVVARRQIARDMADPGIYSDGPRVADIAHQPPRHAILSLPAAVPRSSREVLKTRDRAMAADENVAPLPRPYLPRGVIDAYGEPYQYSRRQEGRAAMACQIRHEGSALLQASKDLQQSLGTATADRNPNRIGLSEVQAAADILRASDTDLDIGQNGIFRTLQNLRQNWYPEERIMNETHIGGLVFQLRNCANAEVAQLARDLLQEWRDEIRVANGRRKTADTAGQDPFMDEGPEDNSHTVSRETWDNAIHDRQMAAHDYNTAVSREIRAVEQRRRRKVQRQQDEQDFADLRLHVQRRDAALAARRPVTDEDTNPNSDAAVTSPRGGSRARGNHDEDEAGSERDPDSTITDPADGSMPSGNQNFEILEADPSPERPQCSPGNNALRERPEDVPIQSIELIGPVGPCHECPDFPGTYHHFCVDNPQCVNLPARPSSERTSPSYGPSQSPQPLRQTAEQRAQVGQAALVRLLESARASVVQPTGNTLLNFPGDNIDLGRTGLDDTQFLVNYPVTNPANVPEGLEDPFIISDPNRGLGIKAFVRRDLTVGSNELSPTQGRKPRAQRDGTPTVLISRSSASPPPTASSIDDAQARIPRPTWADYSASASAQLLQELENRRTSPASGPRTGKDDMIRMLMTQDAFGNRGNGAPSGLNSGVVKSDSRGSSRVSPLNLDLRHGAEPVAKAPSSADALSSRSGLRSGSKRPSPSSSDEPLFKRLRKRNGLPKPA